MNTNKEKQYIVIKNVKRDINLQKYLENICDEENIQIIEGYDKSQSVWFLVEQQKSNIYDKLNADFYRDMILCSYNKDKLEYVNYLYEQFEKKYKITKNIIEKINNEKKIDESEKVENIIRNELNSHNDISNAWTHVSYPNTKWSVETTDILNNIKENYTKLCEVNMINQPLAQVQSVKFDIEIPKDKTKFEKFKDKTINIFNKYKREIGGFGYGILFMNITVWIVLTLKHFMIK